MAALGDTGEQQAARAAWLAENLRRSAVMVGLGETASGLSEQGLVEVVRANVEALGGSLPSEPTLADVERVAEVLGVSVLELVTPPG